MLDGSNSVKSIIFRLVAFIKNLLADPHTVIEISDLCVRVLSHNFVIPGVALKSAPGPEIYAFYKKIHNFYIVKFWQK